METLTILQDIVLPALSAIFAAVLDAARSVRETDLTVKEEFILTFRADSVGVGLTIFIFLLALEKSVQEVSLRTLQTFAFAAWTSFNACFVSSYALSIGSNHKVFCTEIAVTSSTVHQTVRTVRNASEIFIMEERFTSDATLAIPIQTILNDTLIVLVQLEGSLAAETS